MLRSAVRRLALAAVVAGAAGCATPDESVVTTPAAPVVVAPTDVEVPPPTTVASTRAPDVIPDEIRSAPAACGVPEHYLGGYRGHVGTTETVLQVVDGYGVGMAPVEPVVVDLTGDGGLDLVAVLTCTVDDAPRPDSLVLYTGPAEPAASLDLGSAQKQEFAVVRDLRTVGGEVRVHWTAFDSASSPVTQYEGTLAWRRNRLVIDDRRASSGPRTVQADDATFMTADGNVHCVLHGDVAWCDVARTTWRPPSAPRPMDGSTTAPTATDGPAPTPLTPATGSATTGPAPTPTAARGDCSSRPYGRTFLIHAGHAVQTCAGEEGPEIAALGAPLTGWHRRGWDATVTVDGRRSAALTPGSTIRSSAVTCRATSSVVTCTDTRTQAGFTVGRTTARVVPG